MARLRRLFVGVARCCFESVRESLRGDSNTSHGYALVLTDTVFDLERHFRVRTQELARVVFSLTDAVTVVAVPGAGLFDDVQLGSQIDDLTVTRNTFAVKDVEICLLEWRRHLVLDNLDLGFRADHFVALLDRTDPTNVEPN